MPAGGGGTALSPHLLRSPYDMERREREALPDSERPWLLLLASALAATLVPLAAGAAAPPPLLSGAPTPLAAGGLLCGCWSTDAISCVIGRRGSA